MLLPLCNVYVCDPLQKAVIDVTEYFQGAMFDDNTNALAHIAPSQSV